MDNLIGKPVFCKRDGSQGIVDGVTPDIITIKIDEDIKPVTHSTFKRWWTVVPQEAEEVSEEVVQAAPAVEEPTEAAKGLQLRDKFIAIVKDMGEDNIEVICNPDKKTDVIKYNGKNVFETSYTKNKFNVCAHPNSLTAANKSKVDKMFPKEWGWTLRAKFTFTSMSDAPLMKSIIADGIFYRKEKTDGVN